MKLIQNGQTFLSAGMILFSLSVYSQIGINTPSSAATLDIKAKNETGTTSNVDGLLIPRVDRQRAESMLGVPASTLIYINNATTGFGVGQAANITSTGYYFYDGSAWVKLIDPNNLNIYNSNGFLTENRLVNQLTYQLAFIGSAENAFSIDRNTFSVDAANHRVGIGSINPVQRLTVVDGDTTNLYQVIASFMNANLTGGLGIGSTGIQTVGSTSNLDLTLNAKGKGNIIMQTADGVAGNVGIGTSVPQKKLHINGSMQLTNELNVGGNATVSGTAGTSGQVLTSNGAGIAPSWTTAAANINIYNSNGTIKEDRTVTQENKSLTFTGTTTNMFSVDGTTFSIDALNKRVGIGTSNPQTKLDVTTSNNSYGIQHSNGTVKLRSYIGTDAAWLGNYSSHSLYFMTGNSVRLGIDTSGNVGIGTMTPDTKLHVAGGAKIESLPLSTSTSDVALVADAGGTIKKRRNDVQGITRAYLAQNKLTGPGLSSINRLTGFTAIDNLGSYFNTTSGYFTAPDTGMYRISMTVSSKFTDPNQNISSISNVMFGFVDGTSNNWVMCFSVPSSYIKGDFGTGINNVGVANTFLGICQLTAGKTYYFGATGGLTLISNPTTLSGAGVGSYFEIQLLNNN
ncbi:hypothetical protein [Chryseobacterium sp.]|uniref:hypothetical protein n=1 Tax=Chryseobacterium sp. TaxID=1871047 RepID=UPI00260C6F24|nr:hypothetical protein [Chryseobacterium sp.]